MTHNTREKDVLQKINGYRLIEQDEIIKVYAGEVVVPLVELTKLHQQLQKAREGERDRYKKYLKYHYENYGIESLRELITTPLDHSELDQESNSTTAEGTGGNNFTGAELDQDKK